MAACREDLNVRPPVTPANRTSVVSEQHMCIIIIFRLVSKKCLTNTEGRLLRWLLMPDYIKKQTEALKRQIIEARVKEYLLQSVIELSQLINEARQSDEGLTSAKLHGLRQVFLEEKLSEEDKRVLTEREIEQGNNCRGIVQWHFEQATFLRAEERVQLIQDYKQWYENVMTGIFDSLDSHVNSFSERRLVSLDNGFLHRSPIRFREDAEFTLEWAIQETKELVVSLHELREGGYNVTPLKSLDEKYRQNVLGETSEELEIDFQSVIDCAKESRNRQALEILLEEGVDLDEEREGQARQALLEITFVAVGAVICRADGDKRESVQRCLFEGTNGKQHDKDGGIGVTPLDKTLPVKKCQCRYIIYGVLIAAAIVVDLVTPLHHTLQGKINQLWPSHHTTLMRIEYAILVAIFLCCVGLLFREILSDCHQKEKNKKVQSYEPSPLPSVKPAGSMLL